MWRTGFSVAAASLVAEHRVRASAAVARGVVAPRPMESQFPDEGLAGKFLTGPPGKSPLIVSSDALTLEIDQF